MCCIVSTGEAALEREIGYAGISESEYRHVKESSDLGIVARFCLDPGQS